MKKYIVHSDGSIRDNGKPTAVSAAATLIQNEDNDERFLVSRQTENATSNRAEMIAALQALRYVKWSASFEIYSDSEYLVKGFNDRLSFWSNNDWKLKSGGEVSNKDLWVEFKHLSKWHDITFIKVKGHAGLVENEIVDELARLAMRDAEFLKNTEYLGKKLIKV